MRLVSIATALLVLVVALPAWSAVNVQRNPDGTYFTGLLVSGPASKKYNIVFVGDGFTAAEQAKFNASVDTAVAALRAMPPYSSSLCALDIWRVNVVSPESGVDHPMEGVSRNTELDCRYGNTASMEAERCITSDSPQKCFEAAGYAPAADAVFVLVNDTAWGGCAGDLVFSSISPGFSGIITHELGHKIGGLADEYTCYLCDGTDSNSTYTGPEPGQVNATKEKTNPPLKWGDLVASGTPLPTTVDTPPGVVGAWEGAVYSAKGVYRPQATCQMLTTSAPFCSVCAREMTQTLLNECLCVRCLDVQEYIECKPPCEDPSWWLDTGCTDCPDIRPFDDIEVILEGIERAAEVSISDRQGHVVARGTRTEKGVSLKFQASRSERYLLKINTAAASTAGYSFHTTLLRNGNQSALPASVLQPAR